MHTFVLPQCLFDPSDQQALEAIGSLFRGTPRHAGWIFGAINVDGWTFPEPTKIDDMAPAHACPLFMTQFFRRHTSAWVEAPIVQDHRGWQPHFWPVVWYHHDADGVLHAEQCVLDQARRRGWFVSPYRHTPTAHAVLAAQHAPIRTLPPSTPLF